MLRQALKALEPGSEPLPVWPRPLGVVPCMLGFPQLDIPHLGKSWSWRTTHEMPAPLAEGIWLTWRSDRPVYERAHGPLDMGALALRSSQE